MTDQPTPDQIQDAATRIAGPDPSNTDPIKLTASLDPDDDIYALVNDDPTPTPAAPTTEATSGDQS